MTHQTQSRRWRWPDRPPRKPASRLRKLLIQTLVMGLIGLLLYAGLGHHLAGFIVWGLASALLLTGLVVPASIPRIEAVGAAFGRIVGLALTWLLLVPVFVFVFAPAGLVMRLLGRDPMRRTARSTDLTYWVPQRLPFNREHYARQFLVEDRDARTLARSVTIKEEAGADS